MVDTKEWFLAAGNKKVGPLTRARVLERLHEGKVPSSTLVWREGMSDWLPPGDVPELSQAETIVGEPKRARPSGSGSREGAVKGRRRAAGAGSGTRAARGSGTRPATCEAYAPAHRLERRDMWRAFGLGLEGRRVLLAFSGGLLLLAVSLLTSGMSAGLGAVHPLVGLPFALFSALLVPAVTSLIAGALAWHARRRLEGESVGVGAAFRFALDRAAALAVPPLVLSVAWVAPLLLLAVLALLAKIPYLGPIGTGLVYGLHIALGAATLFLLLCATMGGAFAPVVVAFEGTDVRGTLLRLMELVKGSAVRVVLWGALPACALLPFAGAVLLVAVLALAIPLATTALALGPETFGWIRTGGAGDPPYPGLVAGAIPLALWVAVLGGLVLAVIGSVQSALVSLLYVGGRPGNDDLPAR